MSIPSRTSVSITLGSRERLRALSRMVGCSMTEIVDTLSYADFADLLSLTATKAWREERPEQQTAADLAAAALQSARRRQRRRAA